MARSFYEPESFYDVQGEFDETMRKAIMGTIKRKASMMISQLRVGKIDPSLMKYNLHIKTDMMFNSIIQYIEKNTDYKVVTNKRGLLELANKNKATQKPRSNSSVNKKVDYSKASGRPSRIETPERYQNII